MAKKKRKSSIAWKICRWLLILTSILLLGSIAFLNILNIFYFILVMGVIALIDIAILILFRKKKRVIGGILSVLLSIVFLFLSFNINKTTGLLSNLNLNYKTYNYSVVVLKDSSYKKLKDLNDKHLGYFDDGSSENTKALEKIVKKIEIEPESYEDTHQLADALLQKQVDAILVENTYLDILSESIVSGESTFKDMVRTIYGFVIVTKTSDISKDLNVTKEPFSIYVSGIDTYGEISSVSRSDVNMIVTVNPATRQILLTSIPRDYYVRLHGKSGYRDKLTHAGLYGVDMSIQTLEDLLDIEINYYVKVNFTSVINIVEAIEGVSVYSDYDFTSIDNYHYTKGYNNVNGEQALSFARERKAFAIGDRQRIKNQQALLKAIFDKCTSKAIITKYSKLLDSIDGSFVTNMKMSRLTSLIKLQLSKNYSWNLVTNSLAGEDSSNYTYSAPSTKAYVMEPIESSVDYAHELIQKVLDGGELDKETGDADAKKANTVTNSSGNSTTNNATTNESSTTSNHGTANTDTTEQEGLEAKLGRSSVTFVEGDEYIYYGYTATYRGKDVTKNDDLEESFSVNGRTFDDYKELVLYVSRLKSGEYTISYMIRYQGETITLKQSVTIEELKTSTGSSSGNGSSNSNSGNSSSRNEDDGQEEDDDRYELDVQDKEE